MQIDKENIEIITEKYLNNQLSEKEKVNFEKTIAGNNELNNLFIEHQNAIVAIEIYSIKKELNQLFQENANPKIMTLKSWNKKIGIAASLIVLLSISYFFFMQKPASQKLYDTYFYKDEGLPITMGNSEKNDFNDAMNTYKKDDYSSASVQFQKLLNQKPTNDTLQYYTAMSYLNNNNFENSEILLKKVTKNNNSHFKSDSYYFLSLIALKNNKITEAKSYLEKSNHQNKLELLEKLN